MRHLISTVVISLALMSIVSAQQSAARADANTKKVCVVGNVNKPGIIPFTLGLTVTQAIQQAGGLRGDARRNEVRVHSQTRDDTTRIIYVNLKSARKSSLMDLELQSFDIVDVLFDRPLKHRLPNPCFSTPLRPID